MRFVKTSQYQAKFNPDDKAHITAYMQLRQFTPRVTAEALLQELKENKTSVDSFASTKLACWGVPKNNFPGGLPDSIKQFELSGNDIEDMCLPGGAQLDEDNYFVVDCAAPRDRLGTKVLT